MILEAAVINLTRNLDLLSQKNEQSISSHVKLKEEALTCLISLLENAPPMEYRKLIRTENYDILIGYLINILCQLAKNDNSKTIRSKALDIILFLVKRLGDIHNSTDLRDTCCVNPLRFALPGVSSSLFKLIMSDSKLPRSLLVVAIKTLAHYVTVTFLPCSHKSNHLLGTELKETCDNLSIRFNYLINYVTNRSNDLPKEVKYELLNFCESVVCKTNAVLVSCSLQSIIRYTAFISSTLQSMKELQFEIQLKVIIIFDSIRQKIQNCDNDSDTLDTEVLTCMLKLLDNMERNHMTMLKEERESELAMLGGFLRLLPRDNLTAFLEMAEKRDQLMKILIELTEFSTQQPFLFLTDTQVGDKALESCNEKIYTVEKRFTHISKSEVEILTDCCEIISENLEWELLSDMVRTELRQFSSSSNLFVTYLLIEGLIKRPIDDDIHIIRFTQQNVVYYVDQAQEKYLGFNDNLKLGKAVCSQDILKVVIAIETLVTLVKSHIKHSKTNSAKIIILRPLLCPLLNWVSSSSRAVSEASLSALTQIAQLYGNDSTKSLIESNIDYIVEGVSRMLDNYAHNPEITNVLAITFKLSSIDSFYYFRDVYEKIFKLIGAYHLTEKSSSIALLFYRTLSILADWKDAFGEECYNKESIPLTTDASVREVIHDLDIDRRIVKLEHDMRETERIRNRIQEMESDYQEEDHDKIMEEIRSGDAQIRNTTYDCNSSEKQKKDDDTKNKVKALDIVLTEKILTHCITLMSSNYTEVKILALKTAACGLKVLSNDEDTLLPLVHQLWSPLVSRLTSEYRQNLEINLCAFECLVSMAIYAKDFIKGRTLDTIIPRLCLFLESQANQSRGQKDYRPYCMTAAYKCQLRILTHLGALTYHIQLAYSSLWRIIRASLVYLDPKQVPPLQMAARDTLRYLIALDADCVWYFARMSGYLDDLPFELIYKELG